MQDKEKMTSENNLTSSSQEVILYQEYTVGERKIKLYNTNRAERLEEETQEEYQIRQKLNKMIEKGKLKGGLWWDSSRWGTQTEAKLKHLKSLKPKTEEV